MSPQRSATNAMVVLSPPAGGVTCTVGKIGTVVLDGQDMEVHASEHACQFFSKLQNHLSHFNPVINAMHAHTLPQLLSLPLKVTHQG